MYEDDLLATRGENRVGGVGQQQGVDHGDGDFTISAPDGAEDPERGWHQHRGERGGGGLPLSGVTTPLGNTPTITGYNPATGLVSYSYTLNDNEAHPTANGNNSLFEDFCGEPGGQRRGFGLEHPERADCR